MTTHKIKQGYDIKLAGKAAPEVTEAKPAKQVAMQPPDFRWLRPRLTVEPGDSVKIGTTLFVDKENPEIKFVSPASGKVAAVNRGLRRAILEVIIDSDGKGESESFDVFSDAEITSLSREKIIEQLLNSGLWPYLRQRPFSKPANPAETPRDIFINGMDTAPLAPDMNLLMEGQEDAFQAGINVLQRLTEGKIYLSVNGKLPLCNAFEKAQGVEKHSFIGPHPSGNVSTHIYNIAPFRRGDILWFLSAPAVACIGRLFKEGKIPVERIVAVTGSSVAAEKRRYYKTTLGASIRSLVDEETIRDEDVRFISGNVLTGRKLEADGFVGFYDYQLTVIPEGHDREFLGWISPGFKKDSFSRTFFSALFPKPEYERSTLKHGGLRAFVQTGEYEKVVPLDILPMHLVKSIIAEDVEEMEGLGLLDVDPEDFALCSYICPSKIDFESYIDRGQHMCWLEG